MRQKNYWTINYCLNLSICQHSHLRNNMLIITVFDCQHVTRMRRTWDQRDIHR